MSRAGFTLVEVLVALFVATLCGAAFARSARSSLAASLASRQAIAATWIAQRSIEETLSLRPDLLREEVSLDEVAASGGSFQRRRQIRFGPEENLWEIDVSVEAPATIVRLRTLRRVSWRISP